MKGQRPVRREKCACGYVPERSTTPKQINNAIWMHLSRGKCPLQQKPVQPDTLLAPKKGRFDSSAALDVLMAVWR
jgi:hypothetical protein